MVSYIQAKKVMENSLSFFSLFFHELDKLGNEDTLTIQHCEFLDEFKQRFIQEFPHNLPPERHEDLHIDLIPRSSPPNRYPPYRVSKSQEEEF